MLFHLPLPLAFQILQSDFQILNDEIFLKERILGEMVSRQYSFFSCITHSLWDLGSLTTGGTPAAGSDQVLTLDGQGIP